MDVFLTGFPKKLLVATSVLVVLAMVVMTSEARTVQPRIRHYEKRHEALTKDRMSTDDRAPEHKQRQHRKHPGLTQTKDSLGQPKTHRADFFKNITKKIIKKLTNTKRFFKEEQKVLKEKKEYRDGMPSWLPAINFVDIHSYNYRHHRKPGASPSERKFAYLMPKLYKSLVEFQDIFNLLKVVEVNFADDPFYSYNKTRQMLIVKTLDRLGSTIGEIKDSMNLVNVPVPEINRNRNLQILEAKVDAPQCLKNDYIAFRAYGNLLNNWYLEFRCPKGKKVIANNKRCEMYENKLKEKKEKRNKNTDR